MIFNVNKKELWYDYLEQYYLVNISCVGMQSWSIQWLVVTFTDGKLWFVKSRWKSRSCRILVLFHMLFEVNLPGGLVFAVSARKDLFLLTSRRFVPFSGKNLRFSLSRPIRINFGLVLIFVLSQVPGHDPSLSGFVITCGAALKLPFRRLFSILLLQTSSSDGFYLLGSPRRLVDVIYWCWRRRWDGFCFHLCWVKRSCSQQHNKYLYYTLKGKLDWFKI